MPVVVLRKPKEKEAKKGWRVRTKTITTTKIIPSRKKEAERARRSAHNYLLLREFGVKAPGEEKGVVEKVKGWLGRILGKK